MNLQTLIFLSLISLGACSTNKTHFLTSPNGALRVSIFNKEYSCRFLSTFNGDTILKHSILGLEVNGIDYSQNIQLENVEHRTVDEIWEAVNGKQTKVRNHYHEYVLDAIPVNKDLIPYQLVVRVYNEGFAFRYRFQDMGTNDSLRITSDLTKLSFPGDFRFWAYNGEHHNLGPIWRSKSTYDQVRIPMVMELDQDVFLAIHEASIMEFAPFSIHAISEDQSLKFNIDYSKRNEVFQTSWRTFIIGNKIGDLVESNLILNLNEPCKIPDPSWIKPGKTMWDWRVWGYQTADGYEYQLDTESHKRFIDFAAKNNIQYLLLDADWYGAEFSDTSDPTTARKGIDIEECMHYAEAQGIGIILYLNDLGANKFGLERVLKHFASWGVIGVKYGFMRGSAEKKVRQTRKIVELCAKYKLMVNFHDNPIPPSGDRRTWPNLVTKEFCHSQADAHRSYFPETAVNMPLINMIAGPVDACNGWFDLNEAHSRVKVFEEIPGTVVAEVAKLIVVYTGWMVLPDSPEEYLKKEDLFDCIRSMPPQFDSFKVLDAQLDEYIIVARKAGNAWFIGSLTNREPRILKIKLDFLDQNKQYEAMIYEDAPETHFLDNKERYRIRTHNNVDYTSTIEAKLGPGGGHVIRLYESRVR